MIKYIDQQDTPVLFLNAVIRYDFAWDSVTPETVINCWVHSGLFQRSDISTESDNTDYTDELQNLLQRVQEDLDMDPDMRLTVQQTQTVMPARVRF